MSSTSEARLLRSLDALLAEDPPGPVAVGYSGGRDSAVLLWALVQRLGADRVTAIHVDHGWRRVEERSEEAIVVAQWCRSLGVELVSFGPPATPGKTELEARRHRQSCFRSFVERHPGVSLYLAHHLDDQAETVLMRLLKGRSWLGLSGMPQKNGPLRRPFLSLRASVLAQVAIDRQIPHYEDSTNRDPRLTRNFLRRDVLPLVVSRFPRSPEALVEFARIWEGVTASQRTVDPRWKTQGQELLIPAEVWDSWSPWDRQNQLLALASRGPEPLSRRFLEDVSRPGRSGSARAGRWTWSRTRGTVVWTSEPQNLPEFAIVPTLGRSYEVGALRFVFRAPGPGVELPGIDPHRPWVWRSVVSGMALSSADAPDWNWEKRKRRGAHPGQTALAIQDALVRAVVALPSLQLLWAESQEGKLHKRGIFVTLIDVTPKQTESV